MSGDPSSAARIRNPRVSGQQRKGFPFPLSHRVIPDRDERAARAVALRLGGQPYRLIARQLDVDPMTAWRWVYQHVCDGGPHAERLRAVEVGRLDRQLEHLAGRRAELVRQHPSAIGAAP